MAVMRRPLTERERLHVRINMAASEAMRQPHDCRIMIIDGTLCGSTRWMHDNTAGSSCYGKSPHYHVHYYTNHAQPINGEIEA